MFFSDIIGHERQVAYFEGLVAASKTAHAYVFFGPRGVGKRTLAERLASAILGVELAQLSTHPDVMIISRPVDDKTGDKKRQIALEQIRTVIERLSLSAALGGHKVVVIEDADSLTVQAQNALLKILEEPSGQTLLLLLAEDRAQVLPTIISRSVPVTLGKVATPVLVAKLVERGFTQAISEVAASQAAGLPGAALSLADADKLMSLQQQLKALEEFINQPRYEKIKVIAGLVKGEEANSADTRDQWLINLCSVLHTRLDTSDGQHQVWARALSQVLEAREAIRQNVSPALALETVALALP